MAGEIQKIMDVYAKVAEEGYTKTGGLKYRSYAISTLRGE